MTRTRSQQKRERLLAAASGLFRARGIGGGTLAGVAERAGVPPGGVYYYFATKEALCTAVANDHRERFAAGLANIEMRSPDPAARLRAFLDEASDAADDRAERGCPVALLVADLDREGLATSGAVATFRDVMAWLESQLALAGAEAGEARRGALHLFAGIQGAYGLGFALRDPGLVRAELETLRTWLDGVLEALRVPV